MQVQQVILNLGTNAWHSLDGRGGRIELRLGAAEVSRDEPGRPADLPPGRYAILSVADTGVGMDPATVERIFEPFFTTKGPGVGTGLGLTIVHGIVQGQQGSVAVTSEVGRGTTIEVYFPAAILPTVAAPEVPSQADGSRGQGEHVLYLDDEAPLVELAIRLLGRLGYRVSGFNDPQTAIDAVRANPGEFDVVITDFNMPGVSGLEVAREIRRLQPALPVVLTSGYVSEDLVATAAAAGVVQVVYKPSSAHELCETIHRILASRSVSRARE
jgi:CheY-like chemotaxis protein